MLVPLKDLMFATYADGSIFKGFVFYPFCITNKTDN